MKTKTIQLPIILFLICTLCNACSPRNIAGSYSKKLGQTSYYEILTLSTDGTFQYTSNEYISSHQGPYMPVLTSPPDSIGKGTYTLRGRYITLTYERKAERIPLIKKLSIPTENGKYLLDFRILDGDSTMENSGLPFTSISLYDPKTAKVIDGTQTDFDGKGKFFLYPQQFPCRLQVSFVGYQSREVYLEQAGNYFIQLILDDDQAYEIGGERRYKVVKKKGRLVIGGLERYF